ncbi:hypothetical protein [Ruania halotolerans]|uniref:hypothetical protein n=1 Tax=Ruania halotolerans TaxID=2897773 RepID=UPI001E2E8F1B|nr:hypothetical protein [Ruania halotolerans]UFU04999.1 hypothetical protein LQF10_10955 [Ruania halotolerans]
MPVVAYPIVRLQIQTAPMKPGRPPLRVYSPQVLQQVDRLRLTPRGGYGEWRDHTGARSTMDVHHGDHPLSRDPKATAGITVMGTGDYLALRERYGAHLVDGVAGESILVDASAGLAGLAFPEEFTISTVRGPLRFAGGRVADPCVEFSRFCAGENSSASASVAVTRAKAELGGGARGYRARALTDGTVAVGDLLLLDLPRVEH